MTLPPLFGDNLASCRAPASGTINGRDFVPSRKHSQEHFLADSTARMRNPERGTSSARILSFQQKRCGTLFRRFSHSRIHEPELCHRGRQAARENEDELCRSVAEVYGQDRGKVSLGTPQNMARNRCRDRSSDGHRRFYSLSSEHPGRRLGSVRWSHSCPRVQLRGKKSISRSFRLVGLSEMT